MTAQLFATVGTSEHPFTRLVAWLDRWIASNEGVHGIVQHGASPPPRHAQGYEMMPHDRMVGCMSEAFVIVTHGGPGSIMDARARGHIPVVVPRSAALDEHVDEHQVLFTRALADTGWIHLAESEETLRGHLQKARGDVSDYRHDVRTPREVPAVAPFNAVLADVSRRSPGLVSLRRVKYLVDFLRGHRP